MAHQRNMNGREYNGPKFSKDQRKELRAKAWDMRQVGMTQLAIANELNVSQTTVFYWLATEARERAKRHAE